MAAALADLQLILAKQRGFKNWSSAPAQFGYSKENVPGPFSLEHHTEDTKRGSPFMDRVVGIPTLHDAAMCGDLVSRLAKWRTDILRRSFTRRMSRDRHRTEKPWLKVLCFSGLRW